MPTPKTARWLDLIAFLLAHRFPVTRERIYESVTGYKEDWDSAADETGRESLRRKFERDKDELRALGINIETLELPDRAGDEATQGYRLSVGDFYLPYLQLERSAPTGDRPYAGLKTVEIPPADLEILERATQRLAARTEFPLARAAASARRKLAFDLPIPLERIERALVPEATSEASDSLESLQRAVAERVAVQCRYYSIGRDVEQEREIEPHGLFFSWGRWYCVAKPRGSDTLHVFRVDRMSDVRVMRGSDAAFDQVPDFDIRDYVGRSAWELSANDPVPVKVRFAFPESRWVMARGVGKPVVPLTDDGGAVIEFGVREPGPFLRWLLTFCDRAQVLEPDTFVQELGSLRAKVAALYEQRAPRR